MPAKKGNTKKSGDGNTERLVYADVMEQRFVEQKVLKLADCSFADNPRGHNHNGVNVEKSVEKNGIDLSQTMIWRRAKKGDPKAHGKRYIAIDGHGRHEFFTRAFQDGAVVGGKKLEARDKRFLECNVIVVSEDITKEEVTCLALSRIVQNEKGSKKKTFFDDYTSFKWLMSSIDKTVAKPQKLVVLFSHIDPSLYSLMFFKRMAHIHEKVIGPDERLEALLRENCEALGKDSPFGFNSLFDNKEFQRLNPTQRYQVFLKVNENVKFAVKDENGELHLKKKKQCATLGFVGTTCAFTDLCSFVLLRQEVRSQLELQSSKGKAKKTEEASKFLEDLSAGKYDGTFFDANETCSKTSNLPRLNRDVEPKVVQDMLKKHNEMVEWEETAVEAQESGVETLAEVAAGETGGDVEEEKEETQEGASVGDDDEVGDGDEEVEGEEPVGEEDGQENEEEENEEEEEGDEEGDEEEDGKFDFEKESDERQGETEG
ncbi:hypothetical protein CYMTET_55958 [Cymbomonas tetramitiformis]|uniref:Uncharacterized protein n=3 Tax=Cymbomonas tetramitiformis TaxID=36881 RepID=A0AAE0BD36_9CHLO|nr:hypothetical protein CYMTET_55958 [Cymbomonas tetramitiformis]